MKYAKSITTIVAFLALVSTGACNAQSENQERSHEEGRNSEENELKSPILDLDENWEGDLATLRFSIVYASDGNVIRGVVKNTGDEPVCFLQLEPHLKAGERTVGELGPYVLGNLEAGQQTTINVSVDEDPRSEGVTFDGWVVHPEMYDCSGEGPDGRGHEGGGEGNHDESEGHEEGGNHEEGGERSESRERGHDEDGERSEGGERGHDEGRERREGGEEGHDEGGERSEGGEEGHDEGGERREGGEEGHNEGSEEAGTEFAKSETYDQTKYGVRLVMKYDEAKQAFVGSISNTRSTELTRVRIEVHLSNGVELGPTKPVDLAGEESKEFTLDASGQVFSAYSAHAESGSGEEHED